jgi:hypothetical protein
MKRSKKVLSPVEKKDGKTWWMSVGRAWINNDGSTNVYLSAYPTNGVLQIRDWDELEKGGDRAADGGGDRAADGGGESDQDLPF